MKNETEFKAPRKVGTGKALVSATGTNLVPAVVPADGIVVRDGGITFVADSTALISMIGSELALAKLPGTGGTAVREDGVTLVTGRPYSTRDRTTPAMEIFFVDGSKPAADGPWRGEADKIAWIDEETGFECIMLRDPRRGYLSGYVGIPRDHPLWGWDHTAVPAEVGIEVHGGLTYSRLCDDGPEPTRRRIVREAQRICHVPRTPPEFEPLTHATDHRPDAHVWWFGFSCDHLYDVVPVDVRAANASWVRKRRPSTGTTRMSCAKSSISPVSCGPSPTARPCRLGMVRRCRRLDSIRRKDAEPCR